MRIEGGAKNQSKNYSGEIKNKIFLVLLLLVLVFVAFNFLRGYRQALQVKGEMSSLEQEINSLEQDNLEFQELIEYFNSDAYIEEKARQDLGLKKDGENVVIVNDNQEISQTEQADLSDYITKVQTTSNPQKWWNLFFK